jgi:multidrug resistance efflux pump
VASSVDGLIDPEKTRVWTLFGRVEAGESIAQLDDRPTLAALDVLKATLDEIAKEFEATRAQLSLDRVDRELNHARDRTGLELERMRLQHDALVLRAEIATDRAERLPLEVIIETAKKAKPLRGMTTQHTIAETTAQLAAIDKGISANEKVLEEVLLQQQRADAHLAEFPSSVQLPDELALLAPLQAKLNTEKARMRELQLQVESLVIKAPISGTIAAVYKWPGQQVQAYDPIITIATDQGRFILTYIRQDQPLRPFKGMAVAVRSRIPGQPVLQAEVEFVGPQFEQVPTAQLRDPTRPEMGLPVRINYPDTLQAHPGELLDVSYSTKSEQRGG